MALATRCPYCHTTFRVVHDQLKLRSGMVRCGQCQHIFNGIEHLVRANSAPSAGEAVKPVAAPGAAARPAATPVAPPAPPLNPRPAQEVSGTAAPQSQPPQAAPAKQPAPALQAVEPSLPTGNELPGLAWPELAMHDELPPPASAAPAMVRAAPEHKHDALHAPAGASVQATAHASPPVADELPATPLDSLPFDAATAPTLPMDLASFLDTVHEVPQPPAPAAAPDIAVLPETLATTLPLSPVPEQPVAAPVRHHNGDANARIEPTLGEATWPDNRPQGLEVTRAVENLEQSSAHELEPDALQTDMQPEPDEPNFVKVGRRQQKWQRVWFWLQTTSSLILLTTLLAQGIYTWRDIIAARWPITKAPLLQACGLLHCTLELPTQIQLLSIELGELQALPRNKNTFSYSTLLRNHSNLPQSWPGLELVLLDGNDHVVARRLFSPLDYQISKQELAKGFAPQSEHAVKLYFETAPQLKALGYRAEIFYP